MIDVFLIRPPIRWIRKNLLAGCTYLCVLYAIIIIIAVSFLQMWLDGAQKNL